MTSSIPQQSSAKALPTPSIQSDVPLASLTTFGIGGPAKHFTVASSAEDLVSAIQWAKDRNEDWFVLGSGANILIGDKGFDGLIIKNEYRETNFHDDDLLTAASGSTIADLIELTTAHELSGLEHFVGIPSTLGGALWQNLHFLSPDRSETLFIAGVVGSATVLRNGSIQTVNHEYFQFGYDFSVLHTCDDIVLDVTLKLSPSTRERMLQIAGDNLDWRNRSHPPNAERMSAGSVFRKIEGEGAGRLIDRAGLKGSRVGAAEVSRKHANYILNLGGATAADVRELIAHIQDVVKTKTGLLLVPEISMIGDF